MFYLRMATLSDSGAGNHSSTSNAHMERLLNEHYAVQWLFFGLSNTTGTLVLNALQLITAEFLLSTIKSLYLLSFS